jgi:hypothetical protein
MYTPANKGERDMVSTYKKLIGAAQLALVVLISPGLASAQNYNFRYTSTTGTVLATGTLTTDGGTYDASAFAGAGATGSAVTSLTGSFAGQALVFTANPHPPQQVSNGYAIGDDLLLYGSGTRLDEGGLVLGTSGPLGRGNLLGFSTAPDGSSYTEAPYIWVFEHGPRTGYLGNLTLTDAPGAVVTTPGGTMAAPTALPSGQISAISGAIGPQALEQYYSFDWAGGAFGTTAAVTGAAPADLFTLMLFGNRVNIAASLNQANGFLAGLNVVDLAPGRYSVGLAADVNVDPDFTLRFDAPIGIAATAAVPEPAAWAMMMVGIGAGGALMRRRKISGRGAVPA